MNYLGNERDRFFDFDHGHVAVAGEVENYRFLENCLIEFAENQQKKSVFSILSPSVMKNCKIVSENFRVFFRIYNVQIGKIFKNRFFQILIFAFLIF